MQARDARGRHPERTPERTRAQKAGASPTIHLQRFRRLGRAQRDQHRDVPARRRALLPRGRPRDRRRLALVAGAPRGQAVVVGGARLRRALDVRLRADAPAGRGVGHRLVRARLRRVRSRRGYSADESRRRRGWDIPWRRVRGAAAAGDVDSPWRRVRGAAAAGSQYSVETSRDAAAGDVDSPWRRVAATRGRTELVPVAPDATSLKRTSAAQRRKGESPSSVDDQVRLLVYFPVPRVGLGRRRRPAGPRRLDRRGARGRRRRRHHVLPALTQ